MIDGQFALAFTAGMVATVNPCGFAMLPAYLSYFLGLESQAEGADATTTARVARALLVSLSLSVGFLLVFTALGVAIRGGGGWLVDYAKYASIVIGVVLIGFGIAMLLGYRLPFQTPKLDKGGKERTIPSMVLFGVSYAIASLGCTIGPFVSVVLGSFTRDSTAAGVLAVMAYGAGMAFVLTALTVTIALARGGLLSVLRSSLQYVDRVAGGFLIIAGAYLVYYWIYNLSTDSGLDGSGGGGVARTVERWSFSAQSWLEHNGRWVLGLLLAGAAVTVAVVVARRRAGGGSDPTGTGTESPTGAPSAR